MQTERIEMIEAKCLMPHPLSQQIYGEPRSTANFTELVESIRVHGVLEPLLVTENLVVLSGNRRLEAAIEAGIKLMPVRKMTGLDEAAQIELIMVLNQHRNRLPSVMVREAWIIEHLEKDCQEEKKLAELEESQSNTSNARTRQTSEILAARVGFSDRRVFEQAEKIVLSNDSSLIELMNQKSITTAYRKLHKKKGLSTYSSVIKPSDNWNFSPVRYPRIDSSKSHGYVPGDLYANCFWYFVKPGDLVVDPMAGSGMARHVYELRQQWMGADIYDFKLMLFDLTPQTEDIKQHDLMMGFPVDDVDYIFLDLPYLGMARGTYSTKKEDLANMKKATYFKAIKRIAEVCATAQKAGKLCTVVSPNYTDHKKLEIVNLAEHVRECWRSAGYRLYIETYSSRRIQQSQHPTMARMNNLAKERRLPLTDITLIMTFERIFS
jgi:ParB family chromosome partitioning protein